MKDILIAKAIRRLIEKDVQDFFMSKLEQCYGDLEKLIEDEHIRNELNNFLTVKEEEAIFLLKERHGIDIKMFDPGIQQKIIKDVEHRIYTNW